MSVWSEYPTIVRELGELILQGMSEGEIALTLSGKYPMKFTREMIGGKIYRKGTRIEFAKIFTPEQIETINHRFSVQKERHATIPIATIETTEQDQDGDEEERPSRACLFYLGEPAGIPDDGLGPLRRPLTCQAVTGEDSKCGRRPDRGPYCIEHALVFYQPKGGKKSNKQRSGQSNSY